MNTIPLIDAVQKLAPDSSKNTIRQGIKNGRISVGGRIVTRASYSVKENEEVALTPQKKSAGRGLKIVYEDNFFVVVDKPRGMLSVSTDFTTEHTAHSLLKYYYNNFYQIEKLK